MCVAHLIHLCACSLTFPAFTHQPPHWHPSPLFTETQPCTDQSYILSFHLYPHSPISNPRHLAGNEWFPSSPLPSMAVHTNLVSAIPAWCSEPLHPPQCQELLHSSLHTQMCSSPLPARHWWFPPQQKQHLSSAACPGSGRHSVRVGFMCQHSGK